MNKAPKKSPETGDSIRIEKAVKIIFRFMVDEGLLNIEGWEAATVLKRTKKDAHTEQSASAWVSD